MHVTEQFWEKVYKNNIGKMIGVCYRYVQNKELAEDIAQDAFLVAIEKSDTFKGIGNFEAWLRRITVNSALQYLRKQKTEKKHELFLYAEEIMETVDEKPDKFFSGENSFSNEELLEVINNLPEHHRLVFNLYVIDNYTHAQIASELGISQGTSKSHLARARKNIQKELIQKSINKNRKKALLLILLPQKYINNLFKKAFNDFNIVPQKSISFKNINGKNTIKPGIGNTFFSSNLFITSSITVGVVSAVLFVANYNIASTNTEQQLADTTQIHKENIKIDTVRIDTLKKSFDFKNASITSDSAKKPVVVRRTIIKHKSVVIKNTVNSNDSANVQ